MAIKRIATYDDKNGEYPIPNFKKSYYAIDRLNFGRKTRHIYCLENCHMSFDFSIKHRHQVYFYDCNRKLISEFSIGDSPKLHKNISSHNEPYAFIDDRFNIFNVCHILLDKFPRVYEFKSLGINNFILLRECEYNKNIAKILDVNLLDLGKKNERFSISFKKLFLSSSSFKSGSFIHPGQNMYLHTHEFLNVLKDKVPQSDLLSDRIYIDRSKGTKRNIINQDALKEALHKYNFKSVVLEDLSIVEQIQVFKNAKVVIGVHGAGLTNIAFCDKGTKVLEVFPPLCATPAFAKLAISRDLNYSYIVGKDPEIPTPNYKFWKHDAKSYNKRDLIVPLDEVIEYLDTI